MKHLSWVWIFEIFSIAYCTMCNEDVILNLMKILWWDIKWITFWNYITKRDSKILLSLNWFYNNCKYAQTLQFTQIQLIIRCVNEKFKIIKYSLTLKGIQRDHLDLKNSISFNSCSKFTTSDVSQEATKTLTWLLLMLLTSSLNATRTE